MKYVCLIVMGRGIYCLDGEGNLLWRMVRDVGHNAVYLTQNGKYIALGGEGVMLLDNEGTVLWQSRDGWVNYVAVSENGSKIIAGYEDPRVIRLYTRVDRGGAISYNHSNIIPRNFSCRVPSNTPTVLMFKNFVFMVNSSERLDLSLTVGSGVAMKYFSLNLKPDASLSLNIKADVSPPPSVPALDNDVGIYVDLETETNVAVKATLGLYINETILEAEVGRDIDVSGLTWIFWDDSKWVLMPSSIDVNGYLVTNTMHLSTWSIVEAISLEMTAQLSPETVIRGDAVTISVTVKDDVGNPIEDATVNAVINDKIISLSDQGDGNYKGTLKTTDLKEGTHSIVIVAQKDGYETAQTSQTLTVKAAIPWMLYGGIMAVIIIVIAAVALYKFKRRP